MNFFIILFMSAVYSEASNTMFILFLASFFVSYAKCLSVLLIFSEKQICVSLSFSILSIFITFSWFSLFTSGFLFVCLPFLFFVLEIEAYSIDLNFFSFQRYAFSSMNFLLSIAVPAYHVLWCLFHSVLCTWGYLFRLPPGIMIT